MYRGSCLCGAVNYEVRGELGPIAFCHCSRCRKANGSAFLTASAIDSAQLHIVTGQENIREYESSPGVFRVFCGTCASPLYSRRTAMPELLRLRIGTLDTPVPGKPEMHIFVADKAEWYDICDTAPQYAERP